jgi:PhzF family phenazine biosynthesis protein
MKFWQVDSFTDKPFTGNPAVVVVLQRDISDEQKQQIAMEMNVSESAFVVLENGEAAIRWFTPNSEVNLCGHATLAATHILWSEGFITDPMIRLQSKSGTLIVHKEDKRYTLDFPRQDSVEKSEYAERIIQILGTTPTYIGSNGEDCVAVLESDSLITVVKPRLELISELAERGFLITAKDASNRYDYIYRAFFPKLGIPEDPVTGSANTLLAPYWSKELNKERLSAFQASPRGGELLLSVQESRVLISGKATTVIEGELKIA